jgi:hypothetical protein
MNTAFVGGLVVAVIYVVLAVTFWVLASRMRAGDLPPNGFVGMRTSATLSSPAAWYAAHRATVRHVRLAAAIFGLTAVVVAALSLARADAAAMAFAAVVASVLVLAVLVVATATASKAVRRARDGG